MNRRSALTAGLTLAALVSVAVASQLGTDPVPEPTAHKVVPGHYPATAPAVLPGDPGSATVDIAICLDNSGSMNGLLDSTRARIWDVVNEVSVMRPDAQVRLALLTYGSPDSANARDGWVVKRMDFSTDLDSFYEELMSFGTNGGDEFVGWVLNDALTNLAWNGDDDAVRMIFVAGNEDANQAHQVHNFRTVGARAQEAGVVVHSIFAGDHDSGRALQWAAVAQAGGGSYTSIDMNAALVQIDAPQDKELLALNERLNKTYVRYGSKGQAGLDNMHRQDNNALRFGLGSLGTRGATKSSANYQTGSWDLVEGVQQGDVSVAEVDTKTLPPELQAMTVEQREDHVEQLAEKRAEIKAGIQKLNAERDAYVRAERKRLQQDEGMDDALRQIVRDTLGGQAAL